MGGVAVVREFRARTPKSRACWHSPRNRLQTAPQADVLLRRLEANSPGLDAGSPRAHGGSFVEGEFEVRRALFYEAPVDEVHPLDGVDAGQDIDILAGKPERFREVGGSRRSSTGLALGKAEFAQPGRGYAGRAAPLTRSVA